MVCLIEFHVVNAFFHFQQVRAPADYRLVFSSPAGCSPSDCDFFIGIDTNTANPDFLDIYMEGSTQGWVAVGFSDSPNMVSTKSLLELLHIISSICQNSSYIHVMLPCRPLFPPPLYNFYIFCYSISPTLFHCAYAVRCRCCRV